MARIEKRLFDNGKIKQLIIVPENESESCLIDEVLGDKNFPIRIKGEVCLSDCFEHYIRIISL